MKNVVITGNFDGVHLGHRRVIETAKKIAAERGFSTLAFTFSNHPRNFFNPKDPVRFITSPSEKERLLLSCGADRVVTVDFDAAFAAVGAEEFLSLLKNEYDCAAVVCGRDTTFGRSGSGNGGNIGDLAKKQGLDAIVCDLKVLDGDGEKIGSSAVRNYISKGNMKKTSMMLGRLFSLSGTTVHGEGVGSGWGFPTVNTSFEPLQLLPRLGVYATCTKVGDCLYLSVTNVGKRPTVSDSDAVSVETNIIKRLDGQALPSLDLYGENVRVGFLEFLRPEKRFGSVSELRSEIERNRNQTVEKYGADLSKIVKF